MIVFEYEEDNNGCYYSQCSFHKIVVSHWGFLRLYFKMSINGLTFHQLVADGFVLCVCTGERSGTSQQGSGLCEPPQSRQSLWIPAVHSITLSSATSN